MTVLDRLQRREAQLRSKPRGVWWAFGTGAVLAVLIGGGLFLPLVGFLAATSASTAGVVPFPFLSITLVSILAAVVTVGLLVLAVTRRHTAAAWIASVLALLVALAGTLYPLAAVAIGSADRAQQVWPIITDLWNRFFG